MKSFSVSIRISARPEEIWAILTDAADYPSWNPTVEKVEGRIAPGQRVTVHAKISPGRAFPLSVTEFVPAKRMVWTGGLPFGLFTGERTFELTPSEGGVEFSMRESITGSVVGDIQVYSNKAKDELAVFGGGFMGRSDIGK